MSHAGIADPRSLAQLIWDTTWRTLYANGVYCSAEEVRTAIQAFDRLGFERFIENSTQGATKSSEALANMLCQASRHGLTPSSDIPKDVVRMVKAYRMLNRQWTTGGLLGNLFFAALYTATSEDYRWFSKLDRD